MSYQIERNVPVVASNCGPKRIYPFGQMQPGDSFHTPNSKAKAVRQAVYNWKLRHPSQHWITRTEGDGVRIWRMT